METINVGERLIPVVAQKHARLRHYLSAEDFNKVLTMDYGHETYRILSVLVPAIPHGVRALDNPDRWSCKPFPEWEWEGFGSEEAWEKYKSGDREAYVEDDDNSPTGAEIISLFEAALMVNGADRLGKIIGLIRSGATLVEAQSRGTSQESPGANGASATPSSGTPAPTSK
jgi:hypothetical protein